MSLTYFTQDGSYGDAASDYDNLLRTCCEWVNVS